MTKTVGLEIYINGDKKGAGELHFRSQYSTITHDFRIEYDLNQHRFKVAYSDAVALNGMPRQQFVSISQNGQSLLNKEFVYVPEQTLIYDRTSRSGRPHEIPAPEGFEMAQKHKTWLITFQPGANAESRYIEIEPESEKWLTGVRTYVGKVNPSPEWDSLGLHAMSHSSTVATGGMIRDRYRHRYSAFNLESGLWEVVSTPLLEKVALKDLRTFLPEVAALNQSYEPLATGLLPFSLLD